MTLEIHGLYYWTAAVVHNIYKHSIYLISRHVLISMWRGVISWRWLSANDFEACCLFELPAKTNTIHLHRDIPVESWIMCQGAGVVAGKVKEDGTNYFSCLWGLNIYSL